VRALAGSFLPIRKGDPTASLGKRRVLIRRDPFFIPKVSPPPEYAESLNFWIKGPSFSLSSTIFSLGDLLEEAVYLLQPRRAPPVRSFLRSLSERKKVILGIFNKFRPVPRFSSFAQASAHHPFGALFFFPTKPLTGRVRLLSPAVIWRAWEPLFRTPLFRGFLERRHPLFPPNHACPSIKSRRLRLWRGKIFYDALSTFCLLVYHERCDINL